MKTVERMLIEKLLGRMKLINGDLSKCCHANTADCPNHTLIREVEMFLDFRKLNDQT